MHINPGLRVVRRSATCMQIGVDGGLLLDGLTGSDCAVVEGLRIDRDPAGLAELAHRHRVDRRRVTELVGALEPVLLPSVEAPGGLRADRLTGELAQLRALHRRDASAVLARRSAAVVRVRGTGALATAVLTGLAAAGVGRLVADDGPPITAAEIGPGGAGLAHLGVDRRVALRQTVRAVAPDGVLDCVADRAVDAGVPESAGAPDLIVVTAIDVLPPRARGGGADGDVVLPVIVREHDHVVGPLVVPGVTACLDCQDRHRAAADAAWPRIRAQLAAAAATAGPAAATSFVPVTAALAVEQALALLDGEHRPACWSAELVLRIADGRVSRRPCRPHPDCPCAWAPVGPDPADGVGAARSSGPDRGPRPRRGQGVRSTVSTASP
ncbi:hypothetical protein GCM10011512_13490 [Tersicoccus solisilvae]|uniref:THIF-type NAD/FAD binding fold domain-containing protein n=1 Tax=Tersicoccus solisilvae TaxID=1882339 RepID=A0ABQ1P2L5_9MICC|nr:hypothetical protein [Tersicoccus solisilvae]GGC87852.1 hypothetical protein GCM10011512_13490 [Tersicoccus solisilvae]